MLTTASPHTAKVDVLLTHSYHLYFDRKQVRKMQPYPPLGTLYAAALLRRAGISVAVFDTMLRNPEVEFEDALRRCQPRVVAVYEDSFNFLSKMCLTRMREVAFFIAEISKRFGAATLANGSDASDHSLAYLRGGFDYILVGEAEQTLLEITQTLLEAGSEQLPQIRGLRMLHPGGTQLMETPARPLMKNLDILPPPARDLIDLEPYQAAWNQAHGYASSNLVASRGCPFRCNWCAKPIYGDSFAARAPKEVAAEMHLLKTRYSIDHLWFADDIFGLDRRWLKAFALEVTQLHAAVPFKAQSRVDLMTPENVDCLAQSGCAEMWLGVESGSQRILDAMDKGTRVEQIRRARENLARVGIRACYFVQFGYPGETWWDIKKTFDLVCETKPDDVGVSVSYPLPGTIFYDRVQAQLGRKTNWSDSEDLCVTFRAAYRDSFYRALHDALHARVDSWHRPAKAEGDPDALTAAADRMWREVIELEQASRNPFPTILHLQNSGLVNLQPAKCATGS